METLASIKPRGYLLACDRPDGRTLLAAFLPSLLEVYRERCEKLNFSRAENERYIIIEQY